MYVCAFRYVCSRYVFARHMALSCPGTALGSPDVLLFYHPPLAPCSLRFRESVSLTFNLLCCGVFCVVDFFFFFCFFRDKQALEGFVLLPFSFLHEKQFLKLMFQVFLVTAVHICLFFFNREGNNVKVSTSGICFDFYKSLKLFQPFDVLRIKKKTR